MIDLTDRHTRTPAPWTSPCSGPEGEALLRYRWERSPLRRHRPDRPIHSNPVPLDTAMTGSPRVRCCSDISKSVLPYDNSDLTSIKRAVQTRKGGVTEVVTRTTRKPVLRTICTSPRKITTVTIVLYFYFRDTKWTNGPVPTLTVPLSRIPALTHSRACAHTNTLIHTHTRKLTLTQVHTKPLFVYVYSHTFTLLY